jgi:hypothetical protein
MIVSGQRELDEIVEEFRKTTKQRRTSPSPNERLTTLLSEPLSSLKFKPKESVNLTQI